MSLCTRLLAAIVALVILTAGTFGLFTYRGIQAVLMQAPGGIEAHADLVAAVRQSTILAGLVAVAGAIVLAVLTARSLTGPLGRMTQAVVAFGRGEPMAAPASADGEIGELATALERMAADTQLGSAALWAETEQRRRIFETSLDLILVSDRRGRIVQISPSSATIIGYPPGEMIGRIAREFLHPDDLEGTRQEMRLARRGRQMRNFEARYVHRDGRPVTMDWTGVWSEPEQRHYFIGRDMSEHRLEEEKFRLAVELCPSGMLMADHTGEIVMVNSEVERLFGYHREELIGQSVDLLVPDRWRVRHAQQRREFAARPHGGRMGPERELTGQRKDGTEFPVEVRLTSIATKSGSLILSVIVDITERKETENLKREFVATVSHELRTPLTSIAGSLSLVTGGAVGELPDAAKRLLTIAYGNSLRLGRLVNNILDFEKLESGKLELDLREVDVRGLIEEAIEANAIYSESLQVRVRLDAGDTKVAVRADADRLTQVLVNLLSNAAKFSPPGQEVVVAVEVRGDHVRISVRDHGPGIPPGFKARIFEKFSQGDQTGVRQPGGTGLGLSIVKQIMNGLGGTIGFEEAPGGGAIFNVDIPRWDAAAMLDVEVRRKMSA